MKGTRSVKREAAEILRWVMSTALFFLAFQKLIFLNNYGVDPYLKIVLAYQLPEIIALYGVVALAVEFICFVGLWVKRLFAKGVLLMLALTVVGVGLSFGSIVFKIKTDCGCGFMGEAEVLILIQKALLAIALIVLYKSKGLLFEES